MAKFEVETTVRKRNQVTLPKAVADARQLHEGQRLVVVVDDEHPDEILLRRVRDSYAGILTGVYGANDAEREAYLRGEREAWACEHFAAVGVRLAKRAHPAPVSDGNGGRSSNEARP
jgi:AbrB family looped-hinge helix DNA binding protein